MRTGLVFGLLFIAGCGGGGHAGSTSVPSTAGTQSGTLGLTFGTQTGTSSTARKPQFVSPNAATAKVAVNGGTASSFDVSATSALCQTVSSVRTCAIPLTVPTGQDSIAVTLLSASAVMLGQGSNSVTVVAGTTFSLTVGINAVVASVNTFNFSPSPSFQFGTASSITGTVTFADPSGAAITGSGNVPNYLQPITITSNDPHVTITPSSVTTPGQSFTAHYDGSALVASQVMITATSGSTVVASGPVILPGLIVTRYNLGALGSGFTAGPEQIVVGPDGNIWWTERITNMIGRINPSIGASSIVHFPSGFASGFAAGITVGPDGNMWYSNDGQLIARMTTSGTVPGTGPAQITVGAPGSAVGRLNTDSQGNV